MIAFTGSTATGRRVGELAGKHLKKVALELGGKNSLIILEDADLDLAAKNVAWGAYLHQGQICMATGRVLVHSSIADALTQRLVEKANHLPVGDPARANVALGPLINEKQRDRVHAIVTQAVTEGAKLAAGGTYEGLFYKPTVLTEVRPSMRTFREEVFGPVANVVRFDSDQQAVALANDTEYGLSAGVLSKSIGRAMAIADRLNVGLVHVNDQTVNDEVTNPFGGSGVVGQSHQHGRTRRRGRVHAVALDDDQGRAPALSVLGPELEVRSQIAGTHSGGRRSWPGGVAGQEEVAPALNAADGVVAQDRKSLVDVGPPPRPLHQRKLRDIFLNVAATPPGQEGRWIASALASERLTQESRGWVC